MMLMYKIKYSNLKYKDIWFLTFIYKNMRLFINK